MKARTRTTPGLYKRGSDTANLGDSMVPGSPPFLVGGWTNPFEKHMSQNGFIFPKVRDENQKYLKPPPSFTFRSWQIDPTVDYTDQSGFSDQIQGALPFPSSIFLASQRIQTTTFEQPTKKNGRRRRSMMYTFRVFFWKWIFIFFCYISSPQITG